MYNDSNYSDSYHLGDQSLNSYQQHQQQHKTKLLKTRLLLILMALMKVGFYLYRISIRISLGNTESVNRSSMSFRNSRVLSSLSNSSMSSLSSPHLHNHSLLEKHIFEAPSPPSISVSIAILFAFAISVEAFGLLAVAACSFLASLVYLLLICIQTTISWLYPADPNKTLVILAHLVDMVLLAVLLFKLNQCGGGGDSGDGGENGGDQAQQQQKEITSVGRALLCTSARLFLFVGSAVVGGLVFLLTASLSYHYLFTPHAPKIIVVANNNNSSGDNSSFFPVSSVCDIPTDLEDSIAWLASMATRRIIGPTICQPAIPSPNPNRPPPVVMTFNRSTRMDELRRVQWTDQKEKKNFSPSAGTRPSTTPLGDGNGEEKVWKDLPPVLTRNQLPARAADGGTRFAYVRCWQPVKDKEEEEVEAREVIFEDLFIFMPSLEKFEAMKRMKEAQHKQHQPPVSVLILVLESTSRANFHRSMPQTAAALHQA
ncbi:hypothetical protein TYRP_010415 [Tyrophagus putrescentiae]|nr:hypothetical protein TYRP_010415 [Tyrophagus putrescentiae]